ncbi:MAG: efflux RND transporter periplasmic adaptor subunit [Bacteroidales bacterium]
MRYLIIPLMGVLLLCGCGNKISKQQVHDISVTNGLITVVENSPVLSKLKTEKVIATAYKPSFSTSGVVKAIPTSYAQIATPFAGRILKSFVRLGQSVTKGSPLFELSSPSFFETGKAYFGAKQEMEQALKSLKREKDLFANSVGVQKEVEEAEVNYQLKKQDYENAKSALKVFQVDPQNIKLGEPLIIRSPIAGKVVANNIIIGQYIKEDAEPLAVIADLNKVWVVAHVKEKDIRLIERLQEVDIRLSASPEDPVKGKIFHISEMLDESTRSVEVIIECDNHLGKMKPFMYGTVQLTDKATNAILIPTSAILQEEDNNYVLVVNEKNKFKKTKITVGDVVDDKTVVIEGLIVDDEIIVDGAFYLLDAK